MHEKHASNKQITQYQQYKETTKASQTQFYLKMWLSKIPQKEKKKKKHFCNKNKRKKMSFAFRTRKIQPITPKSRSILFDPLPDHRCSRKVSLYLLSFAVFRSHSWWFFIVSQHYPGKLFKNKLQIWFNKLPKSTSGPLLSHRYLLLPTSFP